MWLERIDAGEAFEGRKEGRTLTVRRCGRWYFVRDVASRFEETRAAVERAFEWLGPEPRVDFAAPNATLLRDPLTDPGVRIAFSNGDSSFPVDIVFRLRGDVFEVTETVGDYHDSMGGGSETTSVKELDRDGALREMFELATRMSPFIQG